MFSLQCGLRSSREETSLSLQTANLGQVPLKAEAVDSVDLCAERPGLSPSVLSRLHWEHHLSEVQVVRKAAIL